MRRQVAAVLAVMLAFCVAIAAMAGPADKPVGKQGPPKKTATGTIEKVDAKQQTITVKAATGQQIQTQTNPAQKGGKPQPDGGLVFQVDEKTTITARAVAAGAQQVPAKGNPSAEQGQQNFAMLKPGLLVRVVYTEAEPPVKPDQKPTPVQKDKPKPEQKPAPVQKEKPKPEPVQQDPPKPEQKPEQKPSQEQKPGQAQTPDPEAPAQDKPEQSAPEQSKGLAAPVQDAPAQVAPIQGKVKKVLRAVSIEILGQPSPIQQQTPAVR